MHAILGVCLTTVALSTGLSTTSGVTPAALARLGDTVAAQSMPRTNVRGTSMAVTYVLMPEFSNARLIAAVRRDPRSPVRDLVVLKSDALTPELLVTATKGLARSVRRHGIQPATPVNEYFTEGRRFPKLSVNERAWAEQIISRLRTAHVRDIPRLGLEPAVTVPVELSDGELKFE